MGNALSPAATTGDSPVVLGDESIMAPKAHGTVPQPPQKGLRWNVDEATADRITCFNRHYAEHSGYFQSVKAYVDELSQLSEGQTLTYYDIVTGKPLFRAPIGRTVADFLKESQAHGWPSFRDQEVIWDNVRVLKNGETVSTLGSHLGHNLPDRKGNRYCINLVSVSGNPST